MEHTADVRLRAWGNSFQSTLLQLSNHMLRMVYGKEIQPDVQLNSEIVYESDESCVTRLLNDLIYRAEMTQLAIRVRKITLCNGVVRWEGFGEQVGKRNRGSIMVKAATYDRIKAIRDPAMIEVTLDI